MDRCHRYPRLAGALLLTAVVGLAPGCTLLDEILPGTPFTPDQPTAEITVPGGINISRVAVGAPGCAVGMTFFWGVARNTGDLDIDEATIFIDALDAGNRVLGTYSSTIFNGDSTDVPSESTEDTVPTMGTSLLVNTSGTFEVCTPLPFGSVAGATFRTKKCYTLSDVFICEDL